MKRFSKRINQKKFDKNKIEKLIYKFLKNNTIFIHSKNQD